MKYPNHWRYLQKIRLILLAAGTEGISVYDLNQQTRTRHFKQDHLEDTLNEWEGRDWVQIFRIKDPFTKRKKRIVRATTLLRDQWSNLNIDGELKTEPSSETDASLPQTFV